MTGIPTWTPGEVLTAADVNTWFVPLAAVKTADQSVTNSSTLVADNDLHLPVAANATYAMNIYVLYVAGTTPDLKWGWTAPAGSVLEYSIAGCWNSMNFIEQSPYDLATSPVFDGGGAVLCNWAGMGTLKTGASAGTLQAKFAQNTSNATATTIKAQSALMLRRIV